MGITMTDIAQKAGTSVAAVSVTLNGAKSKTLGVSPDARDRIVRAAEELGYRRNPLAGGLATGRTQVLGLMLPSLEAYAEHDPFYSVLANGVTGTASTQGYNVMLYTATAEDQGDRAARMIDKRIDGLILVSPPEGSPIYEECERQGIAVVTIFGDKEDKGLTVQSDDYEGGRIGTQHLLDQGHIRIAHLEGKPQVATSLPRKEGFLDAMHAKGLASEATCMPGDFDRKVSYESTRQLMNLPATERPTAILAANDLSAHGAIDAIHDAGLKVPEDVTVIGYDDTWYATVVRPTLTSVRMDVHEIGRRAAEILISTLDGKPVANRHPILPVSLVVRESSGPVSPAPGSPHLH
jgi:LacI family transcriptional regulator